jgi:hypothetical protein
MKKWEMRTNQIDRLEPKFARYQKKTTLNLNLYQPRNLTKLLEIDYPSHHIEVWRSNPRALGWMTSSICCPLNCAKDGAFKPLCRRPSNDIKTQIMFN